MAKKNMIEILSEMENSFIPKLDDINLLSNEVGPEIIAFGGIEPIIPAYITSLLDYFL